MPKTDQELHDMLDGVHQATIRDSNPLSIAAYVQAAATLSMADSLKRLVAMGEQDSEGFASSGPISNPFDDDVYDQTVGGGAVGTAVQHGVPPEATPLPEPANEPSADDLKALADKAGPHAHKSHSGDRKAPKAASDAQDTENAAVDTTTPAPTNVPITPDMTPHADPPTDAPEANPAKRGAPGNPA